MTELSNKRETKPSDDTGDKKPLDFSNAKIEKFSPTFGNGRNLYIPFKVPHSSHLKGLCLRVSRLRGFKKIIFKLLRISIKKNLRKITLNSPLFNASFFAKYLKDAVWKIWKDFI